ncbi:hypothetical protein NQ317_000349, partial [Molorchus minor]
CFQYNQNKNMCALFWCLFMISGFQCKFYHEYLKIMQMWLVTLFPKALQFQRVIPLSGTHVSIAHSNCYSELCTIWLDFTPYTLNIFSNIYLFFKEIVNIIFKCLINLAISIHEIDKKSYKCKL